MRRPPSIRTMVHWSEHVDLAPTFRWTTQRNIHGVLARHLSPEHNDDAPDQAERHPAKLNTKLDHLNSVYAS